MKRSRAFTLIELLVVIAIILLLIGLALLGFTTKRFLFSLSPSRNYHHWLIADTHIHHSPLQKIYTGDHLYFPNIYIQPDSTGHLLVPDPVIARSYALFSQKIHTITTDELANAPRHLLVTDKRHNSLASPAGKILPLNPYSPFVADQIDPKDG